MYQEMDETSLLRASLSGDTEAWGEIVSRYKQAVFGLTVGFLRNDADAEDVTHDAFIRAYENLRRYKLEKKFSTWLFTIASNLCRNRLRYRKYHPLASPIGEMAGGSSPEKAIAKQDRREQVISCLDKLPPKYRKPLVLRFYNELSYREIADVLSSAEGTIKTHIHRGKVMLKREIEQCGVMSYEQG